MLEILGMTSPKSAHLRTFLLGSLGAGCAAPLPAERSLWRDDPDAQRYRRFWPASPHLSEPRDPEEAWFEVGEHQIHLDRLAGPRPVVVVLVHGGGGHGRLLLPFALPLARAGYEVVAPDLPHYGRSIAAPGHVTFDDWVEILSALVDAEHARGKKVVLYGLSIGGMTAYHVAAENPRVQAVLATTLLDLRRAEARDAAAANWFMARVVSPVGAALPWLFDGVGLEAGSVGRLDAMTPNRDIVRRLREDPRVGRVVMPAAFFRTLSERNPAIEPEGFERPVLLAHPGADTWTPLDLSRPFFERLAGRKRLVVLPGGAHLPFEPDAFDALQRALLDFLSHIPSAPS